MPDSPKNLYKKLFGASGEVKAAKTLKKQGFKIVARNYVTPYGEADVIAQKDGEIFFVEVKTRSSLKFGTPAEAVDYKKQEKYRKIAEYYIITNKLDGVNVRFVVAECLQGKVNFIFDAF